MTCQWCGDRHGVDQLCQRAQRGMTRRSFCFLFGAGVAGALLPSVPHQTYQFQDYPKWVSGPGAPKPFVVNGITHVSIYGGIPGGPHKLIGTFPASDLTSITHGAVLGKALYGNVVATGRTFDGETIPNLLRPGDPTLPGATS